MSATLFEKLDSLQEYAPRPPNDKTGDPGEPDYLRYSMMPEHERYNYLVQRKAASEKSFAQGFGNAAPLAAGFDASKLPLSGFDASRGPMAGFDASRLPTQRK
jgi:hypothetical protein